MRLQKVELGRRGGERIDNLNILAPNMSVQANGANWLVRKKKMREWSCSSISAVEKHVGGGGMGSVIPLQTGFQGLNQCICEMEESAAWVAA